MAGFRVEAMAHNGLVHRPWKRWCVWQQQSHPSFRLLLVGHSGSVPQRTEVVRSMAEGDGIMELVAAHVDQLELGAWASIVRNTQG